MKDPRTVIALVVALAAGLLIGWVDSRPGWDDTGITVGAICVAALILGAVAPDRPWAVALAVGVWVPLLQLPRDGNYGSLLALAVAMVAAYAGAFGRRGLSR